MHNADTAAEAPVKSWWTSFTGPILSLIVTGTLLVVAFGLDLGSESQRDAALLVGTVALYVLAPLSVIWLIAAVWARFARNRTGPRIGDVG